MKQNQTTTGQKPARALSWHELEVATRLLPPKMNLVVPKTHVEAPPPYQTSRRGRAKGAVRQYRCHQSHQNLHVKEYEEHWVLHVDSWNPHTDLVKHLMVDRGYNQYRHVDEVLA